MESENEQLNNQIRIKDKKRYTRGNKTIQNEKLTSNLKKKTKEDLENDILLEKELFFYKVIKHEEFGIIDETESHTLFNKLRSEEFYGALFFVISLYTSIIYFIEHSKDPLNKNIYADMKTYQHLLVLATIFNLCNGKFL